MVAGRWQIFDGTDWVPADLRMQVQYPPGLGPRYPVSEDGWYHMSALAHSSSPTGLSEVTPSAAATYNGAGMLSTFYQPGFPIYHGYYSNLTGGALRGFIWLPGLPRQYRCTRVEMRWHAIEMFGGVNGKISFGYHTVDQPMPSYVDYSDTRIQQNVFELPIAAGSTQWIVMQGAEEYVNARGWGDFGFVLGHDSFNQMYYGFGEALAVRYYWTRDVGWQG